MKRTKFNSSKVLMLPLGEIYKGKDLERHSDRAYLESMGKWFDSDLEARYFRDVLLPLLEKGTIIDVQLQPKYILLDKFEKKGIKHQAVTYSPDFKLVYPLGKEVCIDVKGMENDRFPIKRKLFDYRYPDTELVVIKYVKKFGGWITVEEYSKAKAKEMKELKAGGVRELRRRS